MNEIIKRLEADLVRVTTELAKLEDRQGDIITAISVLRKLDGNKADNRPDGWRHHWAFFFPSRSGESDGHEVTTGKDDNYKTLTACNCPAAKYGKTCWAARGVMSAGRWNDVDDNSHLTVEGIKGERVHFNWNMSGTLNGRQVLDQPDFGLVKE